MTRHSKNNGTAGSFTYAERQKLKYGTKSARCSKDSLRPLTHCHLCLEVARDPNSCPQGHLACRSCYLEDILAQKTAFKIKKAEYEKELREREEKMRREEDEKQTEALKVFLNQQGSSAGKLKRPRESEGALVQSINSSNTNNSAPKEEICCRSGSKGPHPLSLKTLIPVKFKEIEKDNNTIGCPTCLKPFGLKACLYKNCGHVVCEACHKNLKSSGCLVCTEDEKSLANDNPMIVLEAEGSGFAAGGGIVETKRYDLAFQ